MGERFALADRPLEEDLDSPSRRLGAEDPRSHDTRVIEDQQVARSEKGRQIAHPAVGDGAARPIEHEHPAGGPLRKRGLSDQLGGQVIGEVSAQHARMVMDQSDRLPGPSVTTAPPPFGPALRIMSTRRAAIGGCAGIVVATAIRRCRRSTSRVSFSPGS
jgi:hypothetical protein